MLYASGGPSRNCDGISRQFLSAGARILGSFGLVVAGQILNQKSSSNKSIIHIHLDGGPPQMDMIDLSLTHLSSIEATSSLSIPITWRSLIRAHAERCKSAKSCVIRSLVGADGQHNAFQCQSS